MARLLRLSDEDVERLFLGRPPEADQDLHDLATFLADASECLARPPRSEIEATHLALLAEAIRSRHAAGQGSPLPIATGTGASAGTTETRAPSRHRTVRLAATVAGIAALMMALTAALAFAGVDLPGSAAETAFQTVGVELPNQGDAAADAVDPAKLPPEASETAHRVLTVIHEWFSGAPWSGCEFGARVSQAGRGLEGEADTSHCGTGESGGQDSGEGAGGSPNSEKGLDQANEASGGAASHGGVGAGSGGSNAGS